MSWVWAVMSGKKSRFFDDLGMYVIITKEEKERTKEFDI